ncbi:MAG: 3-methyl-2-oxobutanoate hydroxymethyltransferase [Proteobacteria bacterium]|nr:3-methyl-2-oxobutanoate hydroxymethyltransferase [Pseudomonadota bacterium]
MPSESVRATSAREIGFRIGDANSRPRKVKVIALDRKAAAMVTGLASKTWNGAAFFTATGLDAPAPQAGGFAMPGWLADLAGRARNIVDEVAGADVVVMIAMAGEDAGAASLIGEACSLRRVMTTALVIAGARTGDDALSASLALLRPWALMLVIAEDIDYIEDMLVALRA